MTKTDPIIRVRRRLCAALVGVLAIGGAGAASASGAETFDLAPDTFVAKTHDELGLPPSTTNQYTRVYRQSVADAAEASQSGAHVDGSTGFVLEGAFDPLRGWVRPWGNVRDVVVDVPAGFLGNPRAVPPCSTEAFYAGTLSRCPLESQVGVIAIELGAVGGRIDAGVPIYRLNAPHGYPAAFGFKSPAGQGFVMLPTLRADAGYSLRVTVPNSPQLAAPIASGATFWGVPYDDRNDADRLKTGDGTPNQVTWGHSAAGEERPFLINPTYCDSGPLTTEIAMRSWQEPGRWVRDSFTTQTAPTDCELLQFGTASAPVSFSGRPASASASSPTGFEVRLRLPYNDNPQGLARPTLRDAKVLLPEGMTVNPSAGEGLAGCSSAQIGLGQDTVEQCPAASKIGTLRVKTPLLEEELSGSVYQAAQDDNPFGSLLALYIVVESEARGIRVKLPGRVDLDPETGRLETTFLDNPQLPFTELDVSIKGGPRAPLVTPPTCGTYTTTATLKPWSHPHSGPPLIREDSFAVTSGPNGAPCPVVGGGRQFAPVLDAGSSDPVGGAFSPFATRFVRSDADQEIRRVGDVVVPEGLVAKVAGVPLCPADAADVGRCDEASRVGRVAVAAGVGSTPLWVPQAGKAPTAVYLAGPYAGAPYSLSVVVPAQAGPLDLGTVVVRVALHIDRRTAQVTARVVESRHVARDGSVERTWSGEVPLFLKGIPLYQRDIRVLMDRDRFILNPSSCAEQQVASQLGSRFGQTADLAIRFQVGDCAALPFKPRLTMRLTGKKQVRTGKHPGIRAQVTQLGVGEAGIGKARVTLPKSLALDVNNAQALCEFEDGTKPDLENHCPKGSIVGKAVARTPLLDRPLEGNVYFVKNVRRDPKTGNAIRTLPMIIAALRGEVAINLVGESDTTKAGRLVNTFNGVPDAPVSRFNLDINGGKNGIIAVTRTRRALINLCAKPKSHVADADMDGQNGKVHDRNVRMTAPCAKSKKASAKRKAAAKQRKAGGR